MTNRVIVSTIIPKMNSLHILMLGLVLGVAADLLLWDTNSVGPGFSLWVMLLGLCALGLNRQATRQWKLWLLLWSLITLIATVILVLRAAEILVPLAGLVLILCAASVSMQAEGIRLRTLSVIDLLRALLRLPLRVILGVWPLMQPMALNNSHVNPRLHGILRGVVISVPLLVLFMMLFSSADATFERYASRVGDLFSRELPRHVLFVAIFGWLGTGLLACTLPRGEARTEAPVTLRRPLGSEETAIILGSLVIVFLAFVLLQLGYLFGGREVIRQISGLTLAQYARRGFFELVVVSMLALGILHWLSSLQPSRRLFVPLALILVALVMCILVSAAQRLMLYMDEFGLTLSRLMAVACMGWILCNLLLFTVLLLRERTAGLCAGYLLATIVVLLLVGAVNPVAIVASVNVQHSLSKQQTLDLSYLLKLGPDAVPPLMDRLEEFPTQTRRAIARELRNRYGSRSIPSTDWRQWNASRVTAQELARELAALQGTGS